MLTELATSFLYWARGDIKVITIIFVLPFLGDGPMRIKKFLVYSAKPNFIEIIGMFC
jgi:hypothetical protein